VQTISAFSAKRNAVMLPTLTSKSLFTVFTRCSPATTSAGRTLSSNGSTSDNNAVTVSIANDSGEKLPTYRQVNSKEGRRRAKVSPAVLQPQKRVACLLNFNASAAATLSTVNDTQNRRFVGCLERGYGRPASYGDLGRGVQGWGRGDTNTCLR